MIEMNQPSIFVVAASRSPTASLGVTSYRNRRCL